MLGYFQTNANWILISVLVGVLLFEFVQRLDLGIPLMHIAALLAALQWLVGPIWFYHGDLEAGQMGMYLAESEYFHFALPGTAAFALGLLYFAQTRNYQQLIAKVSRRHFVQIGLILNFIALVSDVVGRLAPGQLAFAFFLVAQLRYVGCLYFLFSRHRWRLLMVAAGMSPLLITSAESAMFHDLLLWVGIFVCYWFSSSRRSSATKFGVLALGVFGAFTIQAVKESYRAKVWHGQEGSLTEESVQFWSNARDMNWNDVLANSMIRLNQGWIISAVMVHVPTAEPFAKGDTLKDAVGAALLPRFLNKNKAMAGGRDKFQRFTGLPINEGTSMNVSLLGESYANFGVVGGVLLMGTLGSLISAAFSLALRWCKKYPTFIFWIPMIFYQAIKAETDLTEVLNQITKGGLVAVALYAALQYGYPDLRRRKKPSRRHSRKEDIKELKDKDVALATDSDAQADSQ